MNRMYYWYNPEKLEEFKTKYIIGTVEEYNQLVSDIQKDNEGWFSAFLKLCAHYYEKFSVGGNLHIVLDDDNIDDVSIGWCAGLCHGIQDHEGLDLANLMLAMNKRQRKRVLACRCYGNWKIKDEESENNK